MGGGKAESFGRSADHHICHVDVRVEAHQLQVWRAEQGVLDCKRADANPEKCLQQGQNVTRCVISLTMALFAEVWTANYMLRELNGKCPKAMESYTKCMDYYSNEFDMCGKEQQEFEASCAL